MKANEAPEKLYFGEGDEGILDIYSTKESDDEVEYTRTDAFIEKVAKWLDENAGRFGTESTMEIDYFIDVFKKEIRSYVNGKI